MASRGSPRRAGRTTGTRSGLSDPRQLLVSLPLAPPHPPPTPWGPGPGSHPSHPNQRPSRRPKPPLSSTLFRSLARNHLPSRLSRKSSSRLHMGNNSCHHHPVLAGHLSHSNHSSLPPSMAASHCSFPRKELTQRRTAVERQLARTSLSL